MYIQISKSKLEGKKFTAIFMIDNKEKKIHFGAKGYSDYTINKDPMRKKAYIKRHIKEAKLWINTPNSPAALSRWILWENTSMKDAIKNFKTKFNL